MTTEYKVTLSRKEKDGVPVITPYRIHKAQYDEIVKIISTVNGPWGTVQR
ncbi:MAG: hypothetical protein MUO73_02915 [Thermoplasmata archaeon]|nr:hypothetical protein [Thermoplasmata archaeon]